MHYNNNFASGWCNSSESIKYIYQKCKENGVRFVLGDQGNFKELLKDQRKVTGIITKDGTSHFADRVVMCAGSWTASIINMHKNVVCSGQVVIHFKPSERVREALKTLPTWFGGFASAGFYGFPDNGNGILKVAKHSTGYLNPRSSDRVSVPRTQCTNVDDTIPVQALRDFREFLHGFLPITDEEDIVYSRVCWYSDSIDGQFFIGAHPDYDNLIVATGDSGHAMK